MPRWRRPGVSSIEFLLCACPARVEHLAELNDRHDDDRPDGREEQRPDRRMRRQKIVEMQYQVENAEEVEEQLGRHRPDHVGAAGVNGFTLRNPRPEFVGGGEVAVSQAGVFLLVSELLEDIRQQILGDLICGSACTSLLRISCARRYLQADGHALVSKMQNLVVHVRVEITPRRMSAFVGKRTSPTPAPTSAYDP